MLRYMLSGFSAFQEPFFLGPLTSSSPELLSAGGAFKAVNHYLDFPSFGLRRTAPIAIGLLNDGSTDRTLGFSQYFTSS